MVEFANSAAADGYQYLVGGYNVFLTYRMKEHMIPSTSVFEGMFVIVGKRLSTIKHIKEAFRDIFEPMQRDAWLITCSFAIFLIASVYLSLSLHARSMHPSHVFNELFSDEVIESISMRSMWRLLMITVTVFFAVFVMLFELAVAVTLFDGRLYAVDPALSRIPNDQLHKYMVQGGGASEFVFHMHLYGKQEYLSRTKLWRTARNADEMIKMVLDETDPVQFIVMSDQTVAVELHRHQLCSELVVLETVSPLFRYTGGWYYNDQIPNDTRHAIDRSLLQARELNRIDSIYNNPESSVPRNCGAVRCAIELTMRLCLLCCFAQFCR